MCNSAAQQFFYPIKPMVSGYPIMNCGPDEQNFQVRTNNNMMPSQEVTDELILILAEGLKKVDNMSRGSLLLKFFSELMEKDMNLEGFILDRLRHSKVNAISELCANLPSAHPAVTGKDNHCTSMRGLQEYEEELRLERFKVKTVYFGGVVNQENK